ncbi:MAG: hypothetical protein ACYCWA_00275 [Thiobacillus sp.]
MSISTNITTTTEMALALPAPSVASVETARQLLAYLSPLFPGVAATARSEEGAAWWIASWATQIEVEGIGPRRIAGALTLLGRLDPDTPLSWPRFADLVRQHKFVDPDLIEDPAHRERRMREFRAKYPGARFPAAEPHDE